MKPSPLFVSRGALPPQATLKIAAAKPYRRLDFILDLDSFNGTRSSNQIYCALIHKFQCHCFLQKIPPTITIPHEVK